MVRRSKASKVSEKANVANANLERDHGLTNQSSEGTDLRSSVTLLKKITKPGSVRRSQRIQNTDTSARSKTQPEQIVITDNEEQVEDELSSQEVEKLPDPVENDITMEEQDGDEPSDSEEKDEPSGQKVDKLTEPAQDDQEQDGDEPSGNEKIMEKIGYLVELVEAQEKTIDELKAKASGVTGQMSDKSLYSPDARYKSMYFESQKKIEALKDENRQMALKLENALGKLEVYEKGQNVYSDVLEKVKDFIIVSNLSKYTETACRSGVSPDESAKKKRKGGSHKRG